MINGEEGTAIATAFLVICTMCAVWIQRNANEKLLQLQTKALQSIMYQTFVKEWDSPEMRKKRKTLANILSSPDKEKVFFDNNRNSYRNVLDFLEDIGFALKSKQIDDEMAYNAFFWKAIHYWKACKEYVLYRRRGGIKSFYENFEYLNDEMIKKSCKKEKKKDGAELPYEMDAFLENEKGL